MELGRIIQLEKSTQIIDLGIHKKTIVSSIVNWLCDNNEDLRVTGIIEDYKKHQELLQLLYDHVIKRLKETHKHGRIYSSFLIVKEINIILSEYFFNPDPPHDPNSSDNSEYEELNTNSVFAFVSPKLSYFVPLNVILPRLSQFIREMLDRIDHESRIREKEKVENISRSSIIDYYGDKVVDPTFNGGGWFSQKSDFCPVLTDRCLEGLNIQPGERIYEPRNKDEFDYWTLDYLIKELVIESNKFGNIFIVGNSGTKKYVYKKENKVIRFSLSNLTIDIQEINVSYRNVGIFENLRTEYFIINRRKWVQEKEKFNFCANILEPWPILMLDSYGFDPNHFYLLDKLRKVFQKQSSTSISIGMLNEKNIAKSNYTFGQGKKLNDWEFLFITTFILLAIVRGRYMNRGECRWLNKNALILEELW